MADVTIYEHANFQGRSQVLTKGRYDDAVKQITIGNDTLSSLKVPQGLVVRLYEHFHFQGQFIDIKEDTPAMSQFWDDRTSSIIVFGEDERPPVIREVIIFEHANLGGKFQVLQIGEYDTAQIAIGNDSLSSALVPNGMALRLYEHANFQGAFIDIWEDTLAVSMDWNDRASSIVVEVATFPENDVEVIGDYVGTEPGQIPSMKIKAVTDALSSVLGNVPEESLVPPFQPIESNKRALKRNGARQLLLDLLGRLGPTLCRWTDISANLSLHLEIATFR
jgi:hypothetical protein